MLFLFELGDRLVMMACRGAGGPAAVSCLMSLIITGIFCIRCLMAVCCFVMLLQLPSSKSCILNVRFFRLVFFNINYEFLIFLNVSPHAFQRFPLMQFVSIWFRYFRKGGNRLNSEIKSTSQFERR